MEDKCPSSTALRVAIRRAAHQVLDHPKIFEDPLALRILKLDRASVQDQNQTWLEDTPLSRVLRASLAARSRYAEDKLHVAVEQGVDQYVILGAGLDTFAYRNPNVENGLHVYEVDHPLTQTWKCNRLKDVGISIPTNLAFAPVDFETRTLEDGLREAGFDFGKRAFFSWLGVTMYLTSSAINSTLRFAATLPAGSGLVFDYMLSPSLLSPKARVVFDGLAHRVALLGEPFQTFFSPSSLVSDLRGIGFNLVKDVGPEEMDARYFKDRSDQLRVGKLAHVMDATV